MQSTKYIKEYEIYKEGTWYEVSKNGICITYGFTEKDATHEDIYKAVTAKLEYRVNGKAVATHDLLYTYKEEKQATLELIASDYNCNISDIEVVKVFESIDDNNEEG